MTKFSLLFILTGSLIGTQSPERRKDIPAIARDAAGCIVSIIMSDKDGHPVAQGSGFLISKDGRVVTNYHVIENGTSAIVKLPDGAFFIVDGVLASDKDRDVAIIKAHGENFRTLKLGNSDRLQVGEQVVAIGNPLFLESTVSNGIVSGIRTVKEEGGKFLQITTPISPGSSGGPLFNMAGEVVGITTLYIKGGENLNFAIPINDVKPMLVASHSKLYGFPDEPEAAPAKTAATADGASLPLKDTLNWINNFARIVPWNTTCLNAVKTGNDIDVKPYPCTREYLLVSGEGCTVTATVVKTFVNLETGKSLQPDKDTKEISTIPLKELDPEQIRVIPYPFNGKGETRYSVEFSVADESWKILKDFKMIDGTAVRRVDGTVVESFLMREDSIVFPQEDDAKRFAGAFKNAVELCGGKHLF